MLTPKTFEYSYPAPIPQEWLETANVIWNQGLRLLEWRQHWTNLQKCIQVESDWCEWKQPPTAIHWHKNEDNTWAMCSRLGRDQRIDRTKSWDKDNIEWRECRYIVPTQWLEEPPITSYSAFSLVKPFRQKRGFDAGTMPSGLLQSVVTRLAQSWEQYVKGKRGRPKYRGKRNPIESLNYDGFRHCCSLTPNGGVKLLGMPLTEVHGVKSHLLPLIQKTAQYLKEHPTERVLKLAAKEGLDKAAEFYAIPGAYTLIQRDGKTYLQIAGEFYESDTIKTEEKTEITTGENYLWKNDKATIKHEDNSRLEERIRRLQQVLAAKEYGSRNWRQLKDKITSLQRRAKQRTRRRQQFQAHWLSDRYGEITINPYTPEVLPAPIPRPDGAGEYLPNGATAIAEMNERRAKAATRQFISILDENMSRKNGKLVDNSKGKLLDLDSPIPPQADSKKPKSDGKSSEHGQSRKRRQEGKAKADSQTPEPRQRGRNRKRERAIG